MTYCDEFYDKWRRCGNFCDKDQKTAHEIDKYLDIVLETPDLSALSQKALKPLIDEHDPEIQVKVKERLRKRVKHEKTTQKNVKNIVADERKKAGKQDPKKDDLEILGDKVVAIIQGRQNETDFVWAIRGVVQEYRKIGVTYKEQKDLMQRAIDHIIEMDHTGRD